jgi:hypothetical protein
VRKQTCQGERGALFPVVFCVLFLREKVPVNVFSLIRSLTLVFIFNHNFIERFAERYFLGDSGEFEL